MFHCIMLSRLLKFVIHTIARMPILLHPIIEEDKDYEQFDFFGFGDNILFGNNTRRSCLNVNIIDDEIYEADTEFFEIVLEIVNQPDGSLLTFDPIRTRVEITDNEGNNTYLLPVWQQRV